MKRIKTFAVVVMVVLCSTGLASAKGSLSLEKYLDQVQEQGPGFQSAKAAVEGLGKQSHQMDLIYSPILTAGYNHLDDRSMQPSPFTQEQTLADAAGVSISMLMPFGPNLSVGYAFNDIHLKYSPALMSAFGSSAFLSSYYQISPVASLSVPLFKDFMGIQTGAGVKKVQYQLQSAEKGAAFQREQVLYQAKLAYWALALVQEEVDIRQDTLERSNKIWAWMKKRVARNLADPPDSLQAEAAVRVAELDLEMARERQRSARLAFNRLRGVEKEAVVETLENLDESLKGLKVRIPSEVPDRLDLKAAQFAAKQQKAAYDEAHQNIYPDITAYASWRGSGLDPNFHYANEVAMGNDHPTYNIGAQFNLHLDLFTASTVAEGYKRNYDSSVLGLQDKKVEVNQDWRDLKDRLNDVDRRLVMAVQIQGIQKNKADQEKRRLELGRTTQFQLLSFENDYSLSRLSRLSLVLEKLSYLGKAQAWLSDDK